MWVYIFIVHVPVCSGLLNEYEKLCQSYQSNLCTTLAAKDWAGVCVWGGGGINLKRKSYSRSSNIYFLEFMDHLCSVTKEVV